VKKMNLRKMVVCMILLLAAGSSALVVRAGTQTLDAEAKKLWDDYTGCKNETAEEKKLRAEIKKLKFKITFQSNRGGVHDIYIMDADGSNVVNLTNTKKIEEYYPHASYDGKKICFVASEAKGTGRRKELGAPWVAVVDVDGKNRKNLAKWGVSPCWHPDGTKIAFTKIKRKENWWKAGDFAGPGNTKNTHGIAVYDFKTGKAADIPCSDRIDKVFNICYSHDGKYLILKTSAKTDFKATLLIIDIANDWIIPVKNPGTGRGGCRPDWSWDGKALAWNGWNNSIFRADIDPSKITKKMTTPVKATNSRVLVNSWGPYRSFVYFADWAPDGKYIVYARPRADSVLYHHKMWGTNSKKLPANEKALYDKASKSFTRGYNMWITRVEGFDGDHPSRAKKNAVSIPVTFNLQGSDEEPDWVFVK